MAEEKKRISDAWTIVTGIPEIWDELYKPTVERLGLFSHGQWMNGDPDGSYSKRHARSLSYTVSPPDGSGQRKVAIDAFYYGETTIVAFSFRPEPRP